MLRKLFGLFTIILAMGIPHAIRGADTNTVSGCIIGQTAPFSMFGVMYLSGQLPGHGFLDLDVKPENAEVFIDGKLMGTCDQFDGNPGYLFLKPGNYLITFKKEGYLTFEREIAMRAGIELEFNTRLIEVPAKDGYIGEKEPQEFTITEKALTDVQDASTVTPAPNGPLPSHETMDDTVGQTPPALIEKSGPGGTVSEEMEQQPEVMTGQGTVQFRVFPDQVAVYIDRVFIGTSSTLNEKKDGLTLPAGPHQLDLVAPGYQSISETITITINQVFHCRAILIPLPESVTNDEENLTQGSVSE